MKFIEDFKVSKTIKFGWLQIASGVIEVITNNMGHFEASLSSNIYGALLIGLGITTIFLRQITTQALDDK